MGKITFKKKPPKVYKPHNAYKINGTMNLKQNTLQHLEERQCASQRKDSKDPTLSWQLGRQSVIKKLNNNLRVK